MEGHESDPSAYLYAYIDLERRPLMSEKKEKKESVQISSEEDRGVLNEIEMLDVEENLKKYDSESVLTENKGIMADRKSVV